MKRYKSLFKESLDDNVLEAFMSKLEKFKKYVKTKRYPKTKEGIKNAMWDFAYENHINMDDEEADYIFETELLDLFNL